MTTQHTNEEVLQFAADENFRLYQEQVARNDLLEAELILARAENTKLLAGVKALAQEAGRGMEADWRERRKFLSSLEIYACRLAGIERPKREVKDRD